MKRNRHFHTFPLVQKAHVTIKRKIRMCWTHGLPWKLVETANMAVNREELSWQFHSRVTHVQGEESRLISWTKDASKHRFKWRKRSILKSWGKGWNTDYSNHQNTVRKKGKIVQQNSFEMIDLCLWILQLPLVCKKLHTAKLPAYRKELLVFDGKQILEIIKTSYCFYIGLIGNGGLYVNVM